MLQIVMKMRLWNLQISKSINSLVFLSYRESDAVLRDTLTSMGFSSTNIDIVFHLLIILLLDTS